MDIKKLIIEEIGLSNSYYEKVIEVSERLSLKKKDFLLQQGKVCTLSGMDLKYYLAGKEISVCHERTDRKIRRKSADR